MPRENKQRGRRAEEKKRKLDHDESINAVESPKRQKIDEDVQTESWPQHNADVQTFPHSADEERPQVFYGMLDEEEQEYFKKSNDMLELNDFANHEERQLFIGSVFREAQNKELKLANSQSGSRLLERLIQLSTPAQLKNLFQKFSGKSVTHFSCHQVHVC